MSWSTRRAISVLSLAAVLAGMSTIDPVSAQPKAKAPRVLPGGPPGTTPGTPGAPGAPPKKEGYDLGSLTLPKDDDLKERIEAAVDRMKVKDWNKACETLQALLGRPEDIFVPVSRLSGDGKEDVAYVSVKKEAARLI